MPSYVIHGMLYRPQTRTLDIVFQGGGGTYRYFGVTPEEWRAFKRSPAKGAHLNGAFGARTRRFERIESLAQALALPPDADLTPPPPGAPRDLPDANSWGFYDNGFEWG